MARSFLIRDLPTLHRIRDEGLFLDCASTLTWGRALVPAGAVLSFLSGATGVFTSIQSDTHTPGVVMLGQVTHPAASPFARFTFLAPESALESPTFPALQEHLITQVGSRGAQNLLAEVDEDTVTFEAFRRAGFAIYARQRIWRFAQIPKTVSPSALWRFIIERDIVPMHSLYDALVPVMVQQIEPPAWNKMRGMVYYKDGELLAFADMSTGPRGIWIQPFIHPDVENIDEILNGLLARLPGSSSRTLYICVRSYQSWLELAIQDMGSQGGSRQAVMVKRLAIPQKETRPVTLRAMEGRRTEITTPILQNNETMVRLYNDEPTHNG